MATLTRKPTKPARKATAALRVKAAAPRHLTPPPGPSAREAMADYPEPSPDFNAAAVGRLIAQRARR